MGDYIESLSKRKIERQLEFTARLISTNGVILWEDVIEIKRDEFTSMPGINTVNRKFEVAIAALREGVNEMVKKLELFQLTSEK